MTRIAQILAGSSAAILLAVSAPALAGSDYLMQMPAGDGVAATTVEAASWSFGASNPAMASSGGMASGRRMHKPVRVSTPVLENGTVTIVSPRDSASGLATGKRSSCATGKHFPTVVLTNRRQGWSLTDVTISACGTDEITLSYKTAAPVAVAPTPQLTISGSN